MTEFVDPSLPMLLAAAVAGSEACVMLSFGKKGLFNEIRYLPLPLNCESAAWNANFVGGLPLI